MFFYKFIIVGGTERQGETMAKDKWTTPDDYHIQDVLSMGRCICCGKLAVFTRLKHIGFTFPYCGSADCRRQVYMAIDKLKDNPQELEAIR